MRARYHLVALAVGAVLLAGCSADEEAESTASAPSTTATPDAPASSAKPEPSPTKEAATGPELQITIDGGQVLPNAQEINIGAGEPLLIQVASDRALELHVHSKPEQVLEFGAGRSKGELVIETPGLVTIEEHESGVVVAQLSVGG